MSEAQIRKKLFENKVKLKIFVMGNSRNRRNRRNQHNAVCSNANSSSLEKQGNGLSRADQVTFGLKIEVLIGEELKFFANVDYQAPQDSKVAVMIITDDNLSHIWKTKSYILKNFQMVDNKIIGHGSIAGTLKYNLSEVKLTSFEKIEERYKLLFPEGHKKVDGKHPHLVPEKVLMPVVKSIITKQPKETKVKAESRTVGLSQFLKAFLCSDKKISHINFNSKECHLSHFLAYRKDMIDKNDVLNYIDESVAIKVEAGVEWLLGSKFVAREGSQVLVDLSEWKDRERRLGSINFTLPPTHNSSTDEVSKRLARANITSKPTSVRWKDDSFLITYQWRTTGGRVFDVIKEMGWNAGLDDYGNLLVYPSDVPKAEEIKVEDAENLQPAEKILPVVEEEAQDVSQGADSSKNEKQNEAEVSASTKHEFPNVEKTEVVVKKREHVLTGLYKANKEKLEKSEQVTTDPLLPHLVHGKKDAFSELEKLYDDKRLFSMLPNQMQEEVISALKRNFREEHPVDYAAYLLSLLKK